MRILGFDPGPEMCGYAMLRSTGDRSRPMFVCGGTVKSRGTDLAALIGGEATAAGGVEPFVVAIEVVRGYAYEPARSSALHATAQIAGMIQGLCHGLSVACESMSGAEWRKHMVGKGNADDALVKAAVRTLVDGLPDRTNVHLRDAAGVAFVVLQRRQSMLARAMGRTA